MTKANHETMTPEGQAPANVPSQAPAQQNAPLARSESREASAAAMAAEGSLEALNEQPAPAPEAVELAMAAQAAVNARKQIEEEKDEDEREGEEEAAALAMDTANIVDIVEAADVARASAPAEGETLGLGGDSDGAPLLAVLALAAVAAGIYIAVDGGDNDDIDDPEPEPEPVNEAPSFTSDETVSVDENTAVEEVVYTATATDPDGDDITYSIADGDDVDAFTIDPDTGEVRFVASPDFETQDSYTITVVATDSEGNATTQEVTISINDLDENAAPVIDTDAAFAIDEDFSVDDVAFDVDATDPEGDPITYTLSGEDADQFVIDLETGEVRFVESPDFETQAEYNVTVNASDDQGNTTSQDVVVTINDLEEPTVINLDAADSDGSTLTGEVISAADGDFIFTDDSAEGSFTIIQNFDLGDSIVFSEGSELSFTTSADDANDLEITVNDGGVLSIIVLDDVLADDAGLIFNEATAEAEVGFDFISVGELPVAPAMAAAENFA